MLAVWTRLELATPCVTGMYSNQLNYQTIAVGPQGLEPRLFWTKTRRVASYTTAQKKALEPESYTSIA